MAITSELVGSLGKGWRRASSSTDVKAGQVYIYRTSSNNGWIVSVSGGGTNLDMSRDPHVIDAPY